MIESLFTCTLILVLPPRVRGTFFHVMFTSRTACSPWIQVRCTVLSYRPLMWVRLVGDPRFIAQSSRDCSTRAYYVIYSDEMQTT
ncbi:hypothetical protein C1H46_025226 [Malus baccata]|uniref:Secreted protein n=1 Tax=Malus baccata TaxID=106549 RepID=A0A540LRU4_MALBA|nr:hypothetical protein C1H46_025226 [Malus baccata]